MPALAKKMSSPPCSRFATSIRPITSSSRPASAAMMPSRGFDVGGDHRRALGAEKRGARLADPRRRAGDDRDLACSLPLIAPLPPSAAVDHDRLAGHEGRGGAGEEHRRAGDLVRLADPLHRRVHRHRLQRLRVFPQAPWRNRSGSGPARCNSPAPGAARTRRRGCGRAGNPPPWRCCRRRSSPSP